MSSWKKLNDSIEIPVSIILTGIVNTRKPVEIPSAFFSYLFNSAFLINIRKGYWTAMREWIDLITEATDVELEDALLTTDPAMYEDFSKEFIYCLYLYLIGNARYRNKHENMQERIYRAFDAEMPTADESMKLWRGITLNRIEELDTVSDFTSLETVRFIDYLSTSKQREVAERFSTDTSKPVRILFEIHTLPGVKCIDVDEFVRKYDISTFGPIETEQEFVLQRNLEFRVADQEYAKIKRRSGNYDMHTWHVKLEQV